MITWTTHASERPGGSELPDLAARRAIRARREKASQAFRAPRRLAEFLRFERAGAWGLIAIYRVDTGA